MRKGGGGSHVKSEYPKRKINDLVNITKTMETASCNAIYASKEIQNDMIKICGDIIRNAITYSTFFKCDST